MLKSCPFCGWSTTLNDISWEKTWSDLGIKHMWVVECDGCHARTQPFSNRDDAVWNWEKRVTYRSPITVKDAAKVMHKSPAYIRAMIINGKIPASCAIRDGKLIKDVSEIGSGKGRINYFISPVGWEMLFQQEIFGKNFEEE